MTGSRIRRAWTCLAVALAACLAATAPAFADEAGDDIAHPAGPIAGGAEVTGVIDTNTDVDWWVFYTNPQKPLDVAVTKVGTTPGCNTMWATLRNGDGDELQERGLASNGTVHFNFTTPTTPSRYYVTLSQQGCTGGTYRIAPQGADAITTSPSSPQPSASTTPEREPNDTILQAHGPMLGATPYGGAIGTDTDVDWWVFYTTPQKPLDVAVTKVGTTPGCNTMWATLRDGDGRDLNERGLSSNSTVHFNFTTPAAPSRYYVSVSQSGCHTGTYQLRVDGADAVTQSPPAPDTDKDGFPDAGDACPSVAGGPPAGCPDADRDGVTDGADGCKDTRGTPPTGCPDRDGDGVIDDADECDDARGHAPRGCPLPRRFAASTSLLRRGARFTGQLESTEARCLGGRRVVLRMVGRGSQSYGSARTAANGRFWIRPARRLKGRVYVVVAARALGVDTCAAARSATRRR